MLRDKIKNIFNKTQDGDNKKKIENLVVFIIILIVTLIVINVIWKEEKNDKKDTSNDPNKKLASTMDTNTVLQYVSVIIKEEPKKKEATHTTVKITKKEKKPIQVDVEAEKDGNELLEKFKFELRECVDKYRNLCNLSNDEIKKILFDIYREL